MKKRLATLALVCMCVLGTTVTAFADNTDSDLPGTYATYYEGVHTGYRPKDNKTAVYVYNTSSFAQDVKTKGSNTKDGKDVDCTTNRAIVPKGTKRLIHNKVKDWGYSYCRLNITTTQNGVQGYAKGKWSPDSVGSYTYAN